MITVQLVVGGALALLPYALTVVSLPLVLDKEVDLVSAMLLSFRCAMHNPIVMGSWAAFIALTTLVALLPWFLGLLAVLSVLGHATWHGYRRVVQEP